MEKEMINIVYVDDKVQPQLSFFLKKMKNTLVNEIIFDSKYSYEQLLSNPIVKSANIILIDSRLFENCNVGDEKYSGEELMLILRKVYPFIEVIVISQNEDTEHIDIIPKFKSFRGSTMTDAFEYYNRILLEKISECRNRLRIYRVIEEKLKQSKHIDKYLIDNIKNSIAGLSEYDGLKKEDVDILIEAFKNMESKI